MSGRAYGLACFVAQPLDPLPSPSSPPLLPPHISSDAALIGATSESYFCHAFSVSKQVNFKSSWGAFCSFSRKNKNVWRAKVWVFCSYFMTYLHVTKAAAMARKDYGFESLLSGAQISLLIESCVQFFVNLNINFRSRPCLLSTCYQSIERS